MASTRHPKHLTEQLIKIKKLLNRLGYDIIRKQVCKQLAMSRRESLEHFIYFKEVYDLIADIEGDIVECGVGYGHSFLKLCCLAHYENKGRKIYGFDSFQGFPEPSKEDISPRNPRKGEWNVATVETIEQLLLAADFEMSFIRNNVKLIKGFFKDSLHRYDGEGVAFLHLDVDLYQSYKVTLEYFWPKVVKGGVVLFDEYKQPAALRKFPGASRAIDEFFGSLASQIKLNDRVNKYYIVKT
jgi:hypothetical protein